MISIHPPLAGRDAAAVAMMHTPDISIHPPLAGRDQAAGRIESKKIIFQSTRPLRGGTEEVLADAYAGIFQSTRPLRGGTLEQQAYNRWYNISIHPPLAGRDRTTQSCARLLYRFKSTRPLRGGTVHLAPGAPPKKFQSTRPLRGGTLKSRFSKPTTRFQSTRPLRGGTLYNGSITTYNGISIHPPLAGRDILWSFSRQAFPHFNPPAPCGAGRSCPASL